MTRSRLPHLVRTAEMDSAFTGITVGTVIDANDPQQMGRVRALCPALGDAADTEVEHLPWCSYGSPFGGTAGYGTRGPEDTETTGPVSYGMWAIPAVGAQVLVMCIDGNPLYRVYIGCLYGQFLPHTMPHGRYSFQDNQNLTAQGKPEGPFSSFEEPIQPLYDNYKEAFGSNRQDNYEWRTRGADFSVSALDSEAVSETLSQVSDDKDIEFDGKVYRQGYELSRHNPEFEFESTGGNYDSLTYSLVTPGFHALSMDDRKENSRMRFRTSAGHQIILDDTNERIYISTAKGKSWIEIDENGNVDIHSDKRISVHAKEDINFTTEETFRVHAKKGIHMVAGVDTEGGDHPFGDAENNISTIPEIRMWAEEDISVHTNKNYRAYSGEQTIVESKMNMNIYSQAEMLLHSTNIMHIETDDMLNIESVGNMNMLSGSSTFITAASALHGYAQGGTINLQSAADTNVLAGGNILETATEIHLNGPPAASATSAGTASTADTANQKAAFLTNRRPQHEPWPRTLTANDYTTAQENLSDEEVGRIERGVEIPRGSNWRR